MIYCNNLEDVESRDFDPDDFDPRLLDSYEYDHVKDHLMGLLEDLYKTGSLVDLEFHLEEVLGPFGLRLPNNNLKIQTK